jgi:DNA repair photolyase
MNYWDYRKQVKDLIPRMSKLSNGLNDGHKLKEKGRKSNYNQFSISKNTMEKMERLLNKDEINSFAEVSLRAQSCPMPLNIDVWDGLKCPYQCKYCFADYFRHSLYTSFFDNGKTIGLRHCNVNKYKEELDKLMKHRGEKVSGENEVINAIRLGIPMRLGIRFEDFPPIEKKMGISLDLLNYLKDINYPVMINTKSDLPGDEIYVKALSENPAKSAIHFTLISSDDVFLKKIEPGAPAFEKRLSAAKALQSAGVRVVARIEPWMIYLNDSKAMVDEYIGKIKEAGIQYMTFDSYSYSANGRGLAENFYKIGIDFKRMFLLSSDSQWLSSFLLGEFIKYFQQNGLMCSTFDQGNVPNNQDDICCSVGDWFETGWNWGCGVIAIRYVQRQKGRPVTWGEFKKYIDKQGGFLSEKLKKEVHGIWNGAGDMAWDLSWGQGMKACGTDENGRIWKYESDYDFRKQKLMEVL